MCYSQTLIQRILTLFKPFIETSCSSPAPCGSFRAPEILFRPELIGRDHYGMHESLYKSVLSTDVDLRRELLGNIVLSGTAPGSRFTSQPWSPVQPADALASTLAACYLNRKLASFNIPVWVL